MGCNVEPGTNGGPEQVDISPFVSTEYTYILHIIYFADLLSLYQHQCPLILGSDFHVVLAVIAQASHRLKHTLQHMCCQQW